MQCLVVQVSLWLQRWLYRYQLNQLGCLSHEFWWLFCLLHPLSLGPAPGWTPKTVYYCVCALSQILPN